MIKPESIREREWETIRHKLEVFRSEDMNASLGNVIEAMLDLTDVEFRLWLNYCLRFHSFHPSHFKNMQDQFVNTGVWDWVSEEDPNLPGPV